MVSHSSWTFVRILPIVSGCLPPVTRGYHNRFKQVKQKYKLQFLCSLCVSILFWAVLLKPVAVTACPALFSAWTGFKGAVTTKWPWVASWACCSMSFCIYGYFLQVYTSRYFLIFFACGILKGKTASANLSVCAEETALCCLPWIHTVTDAVTVGVTELAKSLSPGTFCFVLANH